MAPKADRYGGPSEQVRFSAGWLSPTKAKAEDKPWRCKSCAHFYLIHSSGFRNYCGRMGCVSAAMAWCQHWKDGLTAFQAQRAQS